MKYTNAVRFHYSNSDVSIQENDRIRIDGMSGTVSKVLLPKSADAQFYSCEEIGGVLV